MPAVIFQGAIVKSLKAKLKLLESASIQAGNLDPSVTSVAGDKGDVYISTTTGKIYIKQDSGTNTNWVLAGRLVGLTHKAIPFADSNGNLTEDVLNLAFNDTTNTLEVENITAQGEILAEGGIDVSPSATLSLGVNNAAIINIGHPTATVNIIGSVNNQNVTNLNVTDSLITLNDGGGAGSGAGSGIEVEEASTPTGHVKVSSDRNSWKLKAPNTAGEATIVPGASGITLDQSSHDPLTLAAVGSSPNSSGASLSTQVLTLQPADGSNPGVLTSGAQTIGGAKTFNVAPTISVFTVPGVIHNNGSGNLSSSLIVDADVSTGAAIAVAKLAALTASRALQSSTSGVIEPSSVTSTELGHLSGVTSAIQTQLNGKANLALSNLASVAINTSLLPGTDNSIDLGIAGGTPKQWKDLYLSGSIFFDGSPMLSNIGNGIFLGNTNNTTNVSNSNIVIGHEAGELISSGVNNTIIGYRAGKSATTANGNTLIGKDAGTDLTAGHNTIIGLQAGLTINTGHSNVIIGSTAGTGSTTTTSESVLIGRGANSGNFDKVIVIGRGATATANNQLILGSQDAPIYNAYFGTGVADPSPVAVQINSTGGFGPDVNGANLDLAGGRGTGSGTGGAINLRVAPAGSPGSSLNTLVTVASISQDRLFNLHGSTSGKASLRAAATTTDYTLTLPSTQGAANTLQRNDGSGNLSNVTVTGSSGISVVHTSGNINISNVVAPSSGDIAETSFSAANNQTSPADVTGFSFASSVRSFKALVSVTRIASTNLYEVFNILGIQRDSDWIIIVTGGGDSSGITFSITTAGQIQYTSSNLSGHVSSTIKFRAQVTGV